MNFPILVHFLNNKAKHIIMSWEEIPHEVYFKVIRTGVNLQELGVEIEGEYTVKEEITEKKKIDQSTQEDNEPSIANSADNGASGSS